MPPRVGKYFTEKLTQPEPHRMFKYETVSKDWNGTVDGGNSMS